MPHSVARWTNISPSKRSFEQSESTASVPPFSNLHHQYAHYAIAFGESSPRHYSPQPYSPSKRRSSFLRSHSMLAERHSIMSASFPSFMSVYGSEESDLYRPVVLDDRDQIKTGHDAFPLMTAQSQNTQAFQQHNKPFQHRGSITSFFSESTESSPTTTNSTFDSPLVSDNSATSSPESASSCNPPSSFRPVTMHNDDQTLPAEAYKNPEANATLSPTMQDATKNVKKLTLDMDMSTIARPHTAHAFDSTHALSAPTSPLKEPMKSARKKPNNLTIRTPGYNQLTFPKAAGNVPPTPSQKHVLHQYQSSPALSSLASPRNGPAGAMLLPIPSLTTSFTKSNASSSNGSSIMVSNMPDLREENEGQMPKSQEAPERGYTEGPVCIYDCGVYLYLEPTAEEACGFDTVINVAKEVKNPLKAQSASEGTVMSVWRGEPKSSRGPTPEPQTALSDFSFKSAWEFQPETQVNPTVIATTPTQSSFSSASKEPEYIHVRWDHNSEILEDLYPLCKIIDDRVADGKKVLIHCQLGVSRSASLIIAYGLFKNYKPNFHSMYASVKERSRWVGPNMSLIYQLTDFKNRLNKGDYANGGREPKPDWFIKTPGGPATLLAAEPTPPLTAIASNPATEAIDGAASPDGIDKKMTTPLRLNKALPPVPPFPGNEQAPYIKAPVVTLEMAQPPQKPSDTGPVKRTASRPLPFRERSMDMTIPAHRPRHLPGTTFSQTPAVMDLAMKDVPSTPGLFSPRATEFMATPFGIRGAGDLETPGNRMSKDIPPGFSWLSLKNEGHARTASKDIRSPHQPADTREIYRNIDGYL